MIRLSLWSYVLIIEEQRGLDALVRSRKLVHGYTFTTLIRWIVPYLPLIVLSLIGYFIKPFIPKIYEFAYVIVDIFVCSFVTIYGYFLYKDLASIPR